MPINHGQMGINHSKQAESMKNRSISHYQNNDSNHTMEKDYFRCCHFTESVDPFLAPDRPALSLESCHTISIWKQDRLFLKVNPHWDKNLKAENIF